MRRGSFLPSAPPTKISFNRVSRSGKSVRSSAATSPLLPRARRMRATRTQRGVSGLNGKQDRSEVHAKHTRKGRRSIFKDFQRKPLVLLHPRRAQQCPHRFGRPPLAPDHLAQIFRMHPQFQHGDLRSFDGLHLHFFGVVHKGFGNRFDQILHTAPGKGAPREARDAQISGRDRGYAIFCERRKLRTVSLGCAPCPIQYLIRSASSLISAGFFSGSYVPTASFTRPSRGRVLSMTTTR